LRHHANAWRSFQKEAPPYADVTADSLLEDRTRLQAINTRQTRKCLGNYAEIFKTIDAA
jgi:hypothetical protein